MTYRVLVTPAARRDVARLVDFIVPRGRAATARAVETISAALATLGQFPSRGAPGPRATYRELKAPFGREAYIIRYQVRGDAEVLVTRRFHSLEQR